MSVSEAADRRVEREADRDRPLRQHVARHFLAVGEEIRLWPGDGSTVQVLNADRRLQQLVLLVQEPERRFEERTWDHRSRSWRERTRTTSPNKRRFLVGMDERHLFIAELATRITTVAEAHRDLRPAPVEVARQRGTKVVRQGEWFFVPATDPERVEIALVARAAGIRRRASLWAGGRPHVVSEIVRVGDALFVRGLVVQLDGEIPRPRRRA